MGIYFELMERKRRKAEDLDVDPPSSDPVNGTLHSNGHLSEETPLLRTEE
jgi:hypothetical protein